MLELYLAYEPPDTADDADDDALAALAEEGDAAALAGRAATRTLGSLSRAETRLLRAHPCFWEEVR